MSLFIETHIIQNFAPSNLNRDDTGAPKDAIFGGHRRARISSQCLKRAVRSAARDSGLLKPEKLGIRTKKLVEEIVKALPQARQKEAPSRVARALAAAGLAVDDAGRTQYLVFIGRQEVLQFAALVGEHWDKLASVTGESKKGKKEAKAELPDEVKKQAVRLLDGGKAVDVALFGRMLADLPAANIDAACQVAHAISTHKVDREFDYFTAMDDLATPDESGAAMIETTEFNSACLYRYANIDVAKLKENLQGDDELARAGLAAFLRAAVLAVPTGKQNAFAAHNPPAFVGVAIRKGAPRSLANAFELPIWPKRDTSLSELSVAALAAYEQKLSAVYGGAEWAWFDLTEGCPKGFGSRVESLDKLVEWLLAQVK